MDLQLEVREQLQRKVQTLSCPCCLYISLPSPSATHSLPFWAQPLPPVAPKPFFWDQHRLHSPPEMLRSDNQESAPAQSIPNHNSKCIFQFYSCIYRPLHGDKLCFQKYYRKMLQVIVIKKTIIISLKINKKKALVLSCQLGVGGCLTLLN